jgi:hypothetical protein
LLEVLLVLTVAISAAATVGINVNKLLKQQHFLNESEALLSRMKMTQEMMVLLQTDISLKFAQTNEKPSYTMESDELLEPAWHRLLTKQRGTLNSIREIAFFADGEAPAVQEFALEFLSQGVVMTRGVLALNSFDPTQGPLGLALLGYPAPLLLEPLPQAMERLKNSIEANEKQGEILSGFIQRELSSHKAS